MSKNNRGYKGLYKWLINLSELLSDSNNFQYTFYLIVKMLAFYSTVAEKETSEGRIDCVVECPAYVYIIEFKLNGSAEAALRQIEDKGYAKPYAADSRKLIAIGINFSSEKGTIDGFLAKEIK